MLPYLCALYEARPSGDEVVFGIGIKLIPDVTKGQESHKEIAGLPS